jgi:OPA family glycerol-3-phosphate transporter-like MFS transporter
MSDRRMLRWQGITLATLFAGYAGYYVCRSNLSVAAPLLLQEFADRGLTKADVGFVASVGVLLYAVGKVTNGVLADFLGGRGVFLMGMIASAVCTVLFGLAGGLTLFMLIWAVNRYVQSMGWGALVNVASRWFPPSVHATVMGVLAMSYLLGDALARLYLGALIGLGVGWRGLFFLSAATLGGIAAVSLCTLKASPRAVGCREPPASPDSLFGPGRDVPAGGLGRLLLPLLARPTFWLACLMNAGLTLIRETFLFWTPTYLTEVARQDAGRAALGSTLFPLVGAASALLGGVLSDRLRGRHGRVAVPSLVLLVGALGLLAAVPTGGKPLVALFLISGVSFFLIAPYSFCSGVIALDLGGKRAGATAAGLIDSAGYLGATLSGYGIGSVAQYHGWQAAFTALAAVAGLTTLPALLYLALQEYGHRKRPPNPPAREPAVATAYPPSDLSTPAAETLAAILRLFEERGAAAYLGEPVTQTEHALQAAWAAERAGAGSALIAAALLHDIGHLLHDLPEDCAGAGVDDTHEERGARWLGRSFGPDVTEPIRLHVPAKRYLCATEADYRGRLSEASAVSLMLQGGPFTTEEAEAFRRNPHAEAAVALRRWDEAAKVRGLATPPLAHFRRHLEAALAK